MDFFYDSNGNAYALKYNGILYYYITNLQGDVMSIVDAQGAVVASYNYDPYGNLISDEPAENTVGHLNPLRYRGYVYDSESELYYLQSRYYDPVLGRFLNADTFASTGQGILGINVFVYCLNNPCIYVDPNGYEGIVGFGFQIDGSSSHGTCGVEVVIYIDPKVVAETTDDDSRKIAVAVYSYSGVSINLLEMTLAPQLMEMTSMLNLEQLDGMNEDELLIMLSGILSDYQLSGSVFVIYGHDNFESAESYSGAFDTWSGSVSKPGSVFSAGLYYSYSDTCWVVGAKVGISTSATANYFPVNIQYSRTFYSQPVICP